MTTRPELLTPEFLSLSARLGKDPLQVQGPGGNTSVKDADVMWIKASGTELARAESEGIFVPVDRRAAVSEAQGAQGDGSCRATVIDEAIGLRPSIETTFHAALDFPVVAHTHSVSTLVHAISPEGRELCREKLAGLPFAVIPYAKPGLPLTREIIANSPADSRVIVLQNHGLICCGESAREVSGLIDEVEKRLRLPARRLPDVARENQAPDGFEWAQEGWIAFDERICSISASGSYYPDHVVFLGPGLPSRDHDGNPPSILLRGEGIALRTNAMPAQRAMLRCLSDVLSRLPDGWSVDPIGAEAEAELLNWEAEKHRQSLSARK